MGIKGHLTLNTQLLLLLLLSRFSRVQLCATPQMAAHQAPPSLGFSRQEHWSGVPFPSPMHESGKGKWSHSVVSYSLRPHALQPTRLLCPWDFSGKSTRVGCHCLLRSIQQTASIFFYEILRKATWWIRFKYNLMTISQNHWQWQSIVKKDRNNSNIAQFSSVLSLRHVQLFATPWIAARQASLSTTNSRSLLKFMSIELVMPSI